MTFSYLDLDTWPRRASFDFFRGFELPFFNLTVQLRVQAFRAYCQRESLPFSLAMIQRCLLAANDTEPLRYRLAGERVRIYEEVQVGNTVLHDDESFSFCYFPFRRDLHEFCREGQAILQAHLAQTDFKPRDEQDDVIHMSTIPWLHFTAMQHARRLGRADSIPKVVLGKYEARDGDLLMPVSVEVHHALMDGLHVGRYLERLQASLMLD